MLLFMLVVLMLFLYFVFFFQAEDGIRYWSVTGVQTCALPICNQRLPPPLQPNSQQHDARGREEHRRHIGAVLDEVLRRPVIDPEQGGPDEHHREDRSEERRVGKEGRSERWREQ